jgi:3-methyladenine DNA glycosylase Mpg
MELVSEVIPDEWFARPGVRVAPGLLGAHVCCHIPTDGQSGRWKIVEVEAYRLEELSAATRQKRVRKSERKSHPEIEARQKDLMPGWSFLVRRGPHTYLALSAGQNDLILIRALEPEFPCDVLRLRDASGPAKVTRALGINRNYDRCELSPENGLWIEFPSDKPPRSQIVRTPRVRSESDSPLQLRWYLKSSLSVSQQTYSSAL